MKIAFIGAQGVGKTTLSQQVHKLKPDSIIVKETVRECPYPCDQDADFKTEWWVLSHSILAEQEARELKKDLVITDRCLLDIAVYTKLIHGAHPERINAKQRDLIELSIEKWFLEDPYDIMFFLKVNPDIWKTRDLDDGFRSLDINWYNVLTSEFESALQRFNMTQKTKLKVIENNGSFQNTVNEVISAIDGHKQSLSPRPSDRNLGQRL